VHARQILADDPERQELRAGEERDRRGEEGEPGKRVPADEVGAEHEDEQDEPQDRGEEADQAGEAQRPRAERCQPRQGGAREPREAVVRHAGPALAVRHLDHRIPRGRPAEQDVQDHVRTPEERERLAQVGTEGAEAADLARKVAPDRRAHHEPGDRRRDVAEEPVLALERLAVDDVDVLRQRVEQARDLLGRVLEVVVERDDDGKPCGADAGKGGVVLPVVAGELEATHAVVGLGERPDPRPAAVGAAVVDEEQLVLDAGERQVDALGQLVERLLAVEDGDDDGDAGGGAHLIRPPFTAPQSAIAPH
jgi:hypothetical protein